MSASFDHVALVVPDLETVLERLELTREEVGPIEAFPGEGTREVYIGNDDAASRLLLMQPTDETGPYARSLRRRGPGLHHVALAVSNLTEFLTGVEGWLLHPASASSIQHSQTAWLARPGVPCLVEVQESDHRPGGAATTSGLRVPVDPSLADRVSTLEGCLGVAAGWLAPVGTEASFEIEGRRMSLSTLLRG